MQDTWVWIELIGHFNKCWDFKSFHLCERLLNQLIRQHIIADFDRLFVHQSGLSYNKRENSNHQKWKMTPWSTGVGSYSPLFWVGLVNPEKVQTINHFNTTHVDLSGLCQYNGFAYCFCWTHIVSSISFSNTEPLVHSLKGSEFCTNLYLPDLEDFARSFYNMLTPPILSKMNGEKSERFIELQTNDKIGLFWRFGGSPGRHLWRLLMLTDVVSLTSKPASEQNNFGCVGLLGLSSLQDILIIYSKDTLR